MRFRRDRLDDWNPAKSEAGLRRWRRYATVAHWFGVTLNGAIAGWNAAAGRWWLAGFSITMVVILIFARAKSIEFSHVSDTLAAEHETAVNPHLEEGMTAIGDGPLDLEVRSLLPGVAQATSVVMTSIIGRALSEGWTIDRIIEASNMPGDAIRFYAARARRGI